MPNLAQDTRNIVRTDRPQTSKTMPTSKYPVSSEVAAKKERNQSYKPTKISKYMGSASQDIGGAGKHSGRTLSSGFQKSFKDGDGGSRSLMNKFNSGFSMPLENQKGTKVISPDKQAKASKFVSYQQN